MSKYWILTAILLPILGGALTPLLPFKKREQMMIYVEAVMLATSAIVIALIAHGKMSIFEVIYFVRGLSISFKIDGMTMVFAGLVSILWPLATLYAFEYMEHEGHEKIFFMFYSMTYGVTLGIAFASDMLSMYFFYELLTLVTVPLVMHTLTREAILASRKYLYYSLGGAAFALIGLVFLLSYGDTLEFTMGGVLDMAQVGDKKNLLLTIYLLAFMGFGVKAAIWPLSSWLPQAGVAPTPVTALLHAVAVVKAGVFAIIRLTYYSFGCDFLRGTWVQAVVMGLAMFSIVYGCSRAVKETHIKRRLAYSTVSNLSYIIFGATIMTPLGLVGALCHLICHAFMKICSFLCAGAIMHQTGKSYIYELNGMGRKMPVVFTCFTISAFGLMGVPGLAGFISKWNLAQAAVESGNVQAYFGIGCLLISALLTAIYMLSIVVRAFFPGRDFDYGTLQGIKDPTWKMCLPLMLFAAAIVCLGLFSSPLVGFLQDIAAGKY
ncbi:MAG: proton-conducting transporter membrane subunit [Eubacteriales bacterium]|nr:proton-conducting transporter membrane subunit [Eubacteriales bacterium]